MFGLYSKPTLFDTLAAIGTALTPAEPIKGLILFSLDENRFIIFAIITPAAVAKENALNLGLKDRTEFICQSWTDSNLSLPQFDMVVSNPPYIPSAEIETLATEVKEYDPLSALDGGADGLNCYKDIAKILPDLLKDGAYALFEVGYNQADDVMEIYRKAGLKPQKIVKDLAGIKRCIILKK